MGAQPFRIDVPDSVLSDLKRRLVDTRWPDEIADSGWTYGSNLGYLKELVEYWADGFDWRAQERHLNSMPQFKAQVDRLGIHFGHIKGKGPSPFPLIMIHGWPGSFFEMYKVAGPLTDPASHGGNPTDAFDLIVPSLPGYGFSDRPSAPGMNAVRVAEVFTNLMVTELGYERFGAQGGDWGAVVCTALGGRHASHVAGIHLNMVTTRAVGEKGEDDSEAERAWQAESKAWMRDEAAYSRVQGTKPQTLSYGLNDSPAGLAGWIVEKWRTWSDCAGDIESVYTKDELLTNIMIYWVTQTIGSSVRFYYENSRGQPLVPEGQRVEVPTGVAVFPKEIRRPPRKRVEQVYNVDRWTEMPRGGHFAAMEQPGLLVQDIREFFRPIRGSSTNRGA
jgi:pimeloyl-ACP methyl ester carboxylesterase